MKRTLSFFLSCVVIVSSFFALNIQAAAYGNNTIDTATPININQSYTSNILSGSDEDWFKFNLTSAGKINIDFSHGFDDTTNERWLLNLYDNNRNFIDGWGYVGEKTKIETSGNIGLPAGTYYVMVEAANSYYPSDVDYCFKVNFTASSVWEKEFNDDYYNSSNTISLNKNYYGTIMTGSDEDWFKFNLTSAGKINIDFSHGFDDTTNERWLLNLYDDNKNYIDGWGYVGEKTKTETSENIGLPAGTYYIMVEAANSYYPSDVDYSFKVNFTVSSVWEKEFNDDYYNSSNTISLNKNYYGTIMTGSDKDWFKFKLDSKKNIFINFLHGFDDTTSERWSLSLYDDNKECIQGWSYIGENTKNVKSPNITLPRGTYYILVEATNSYYPCDADYRFMVSEYLATPKLTKIANTTTGVKVTWGKVTGATSYVVYRKTGSGSWKRIADGIKNTYYTDKTAKSGTTYKYTVRAQKGSLLSGYVKNGISIKCLADPTLKVPTSSRSGITLKWTKTAGASGYVIYRKAGNGSWKKLVTEKGVSNLSYIDKSARKGTTYTYKIRAYYSKTYSAYSNTRQIKDKY